MSVNTYNFNHIMVNSSPENHGVYALWQNGTLIYYGRAHGVGVSIRSRLKSHLSGSEGYCTQQATHYQWEMCQDPVMREKQLLESYKSQYGRLPRCNERIG